MRPSNVVGGYDDKIRYRVYPDIIHFIFESIAPYSEKNNGLRKDV